MRYTHFIRHIHGTERITERLPFNESHGAYFAEGFNELEALRLVNQWNRMSHAHTPVLYSYTLGG